MEFRRQAGARTRQAFRWRRAAIVDQAGWREALAFRLSARWRSKVAGDRRLSRRRAFARRERRGKKPSAFWPMAKTPPSSKSSPRPRRPRRAPTRSKPSPASFWTRSGARAKPKRPSKSWNGCWASPCPSSGTVASPRSPRRKFWPCFVAVEARGRHETATPASRNHRRAFFASPSRPAAPKATRRALCAAL